MEDQLQLVTFEIGQEEFGLDILGIREIIKVADLTGIPTFPSLVAGIMNLSGKVIPVIDLRHRFGMDERAHDQNTRVNVAVTGGQTVGLVVDAIGEVPRVPSDSIEQTPDVIIGSRSGFLDSIKIADRLLILIDLGRIIVLMSVMNILMLP